MQISLPGDVMSIVVRFFDTKDCARMSQVNKAWNQFLYRESLWGTERWVLRPHMVEEIICPKPPAGARHIGTPHKGCFLRWVSEYDQLFRVSMEELEKEWEKEIEPKKARKRKSKIEELKLPYNPEEEASDPRSWSDNPEDYLK